MPGPSPTPANRHVLLIASLVTALSASGAPGRGLAGEPLAEQGLLAPAEVLDDSNWREAEGLLPPEILRHYASGEYANRVERWDGAMVWEPAWHDAVRSNRETLTLDEKGGIVNKSTGDQPSYIFGYPFPDIDPEDPNAGTKILWNYSYGVYHNGNRRNTAELTWLSPRGVDRTVGQDVYVLFYDGQPRARAPRENPNNLLFQFLSTTIDPGELRGTTLLSWRYRDAEKRDAIWNYLPALRRVRSISPTNGSDGVLGSDISRDDGPFFDGKPEDFVWKLVGEKDQLVLADPVRHRDGCVSRPLPTGGWETFFEDVPMAGFQDPKWEGLPWAPVSHVLIPRRVWVIEGVPKDRYYLYGKIQLHIDRETYQGSWNRAFGWKGELLKTLQSASTGPNRTPDGGRSFFDSGVGGCIVGRIAENLKLGRATVAAVDAKKNPISWSAVPLDPDFFDHAALARFGR